MYTKSTQFLHTFSNFGTFLVKNKFDVPFGILLPLVADSIYKIKLS